MDSYHITGGKRLVGEHRLSGAKNGVLPILAATVMTGDACTISSCPDLSDVHTMTEILQALGCAVQQENGVISVDARSACCAEVPRHLMGGMRSSVFLMGPLLARFGCAALSFPGGCTIGERPIDIHLDGLKKLGAEIEWEDERLICRTTGLKGAEIRLSFPSVGATENLMMAACAAQGETRIIHPAREPEIQDLQNFLNACGARVSGAGTGEIVISGKTALQGCDHRVIPDRIEAGTFLAAAAATGGEIRLLDCAPSQMAQIIDKLAAAGCRISVTGSTLWLSAPERLKAVREIKTLPYPGFPTDMQSQFAVVLTCAKGESRVTETIFENRFKYVPHLRRMGAQIDISGQSAVIRGVPRLHGARVSAEDLRGGAALVLAGLSAEGKTIVENVCHIDRGYDKLEVALNALGAKIERKESCRKKTDSRNGRKNGRKNGAGGDFCS